MVAYFIHYFIILLVEYLSKHVDTNFMNIQSVQYDECDDINTSDKGLA